MKQRFFAESSLDLGSMSNKIFLVFFNIEKKQYFLSGIRSRSVPSTLKYLFQVLIFYILFAISQKLNIALSFQCCVEKLFVKFQYTISGVKNC